MTKIINLDPAVIQYRGVTYNINNDGEWANQATGKVPAESFQAFMDQELVKAGGSTPGPSPTASTKTPDTRRVSRARGRE